MLTLKTGRIYCFFLFSFVDNSCSLRIADLEKQLAEREQETKDLEVKLFESSLGRSKGPSFDDEPLPTQKTNRALFNEDAVLSTPSCPPMEVAEMFYDSLPPRDILGMNTEHYDLNCS